MLAGHSLGGSLALLLALDALVNHTYETSSNNASSSYDRDHKNGKNENMHKKSKIDSDSSQTSSSSSRSRDSDDNIEDAPPTPTQSRTSTSTYRSNSYSHHNDKRCTSTAHVSVLDRLHIVTFGQPELADPLFFKGLKMQHSAAKKLLEERYQLSFFDFKLEY